MKFETKTLFCPSDAFPFAEHYADLLSTISGLSEGKIESYFVSKAVGARSKSLAGTVRTLILNDLQLKGWTIKWSPFAGSKNYESAIWNFDAAKKISVHQNIAWITLEISFDNRLGIGTHLVKSSVANNPNFRIEFQEDIAHHCIIAASSAFKAGAGLDNSVATAEEFATASKPYSLLKLTGTSLISLNALETLEVLQRKSDGRTKAKLLNLDIN